MVVWSTVLFGGRDQASRPQTRCFRDYRSKRAVVDVWSGWAALKAFASRRPVPGPRQWSDQPRLMLCLPNSECIGHPHQVSQRTGAHLLHNTAAMHLDGAFR